jgi:hypothetical protein
MDFPVISHALAKTFRAIGSVFGIQAVSLVREGSFAVLPTTVLGVNNEFAFSIIYLQSSRVRTESMTAGGSHELVTDANPRPFVRHVTTTHVKRINKLKRAKYIHIYSFI